MDLIDFKEVEVLKFGDWILVVNERKELESF